MSQTGLTIGKEAPRKNASGVVAGLAAFVSWGLVPLYWKQLHGVGATEILAHRFIWTLVFCVVLVTATRKWGEIRDSLRSRRQLILSVGSSVTIAVNWFVFIWAVNAGRIVETSIGYFMNPLVNVLFGIVVFHERLTLLQWLAVAVAATGVTYSAASFGEVPWIAFALCGSFGLYAVFRKLSHATSLSGLFLETAIITPFMLVLVSLKAADGTGAFRLDHPFNATMLAGAGIITALPLLWFAQAARMLKLSTVGIMQYLTPSLTLSIGTLIYDEPFTPARKVTFSCIWVALVLYNVATMLRIRRGSGAPNEPAA